MDFDKVLNGLLNEFERRRIRYALMGGFALSLWGVPRATVDLDFLVALDDMGAVHEVLTSMGYERVHHSQNVSQYRSPLPDLGEIDFIHAFRRASEGMLRRAAIREILGGRQTIRVLLPEDIVGLKVQAIANNPSRGPTDQADIEALMRLHGSRLAWDRIREYFELFGFSDLCRELEARYRGHG